MKKVYASLHRGSFGFIDTEVNMELSRELDDKDRELILDAMENLRDALVRRSYEQASQLQDMLRREEQNLLSLFSSHTIYVEYVENEYTKGHPAHSRWLVVTTKLGRIKIGWRKRVIHIDWSNSDIEASPNDIFRDEEVTKWENGIHAWGYEKAQEYIDTLMSLV